MERTSPNYNDPQFTRKPEDSPLDKYEAGLDKAFNAADKVYSVGRKIAYIFMGLFFFFIGGALLIWGIFNYTDRVKELDTYVKTTGTVVSLREVPPTDNSGVTYAPTYVYKDASGREFKHESNHSSDPPEYKVGEKIEVFYDKDNPNEAFENSFLSKWGGSITLFIVPLVLFPVGLWMLISAFKRNKPSKQQNYSSGQGSTVSIG